jgi:hypothetical protein
LDLTIQLSELYEQYAVGIMRIFTINPEALAHEMKKLPYIEKLVIDLRGISVRVAEGMEDNVYEDAAKLAKNRNVKLLGLRQRFLLQPSRVGRPGCLEPSSRASRLNP